MPCVLQVKPVASAHPCVLSLCVLSLCLPALRARRSNGPAPTAAAKGSDVQRVNIGIFGVMNAGGSSCCVAQEKLITIYYLYLGHARQWAAHRLLCPFWLWTPPLRPHPLALLHPPPLCARPSPFAPRIPASRQEQPHEPADPERDLHRGRPPWHHRRHQGEPLALFH